MAIDDDILAKVNAIYDLLESMITVDSNGNYFTETALQNVKVNGYGDTEVIYTVTVDGEAVPNCLVWVTSVNDISAKVIASGITNDLGKVTFYLNTGITYYFWRKIAGYSFLNPDSQLVE